MLVYISRHNYGSVSETHGKTQKNACAVRVFHVQLPACGYIQTLNLKITMPSYRKSRKNSRDLLPWHKRTVVDLKLSHPRCVVKIQVREENPILYSHKTQLNIKLSLLLYYNITTTCFGLNYRPSSGCIWKLYSYNYNMHALIYCVGGVGGI